MADESIPQNPDRVERIARGDRGFLDYGAPVVCCTYGSTIEVCESSSAEGPHVWLKMASSLDDKPGESHAHLSADQARAVIERLQAFLDDIPERWGEEAEVDG